MEAAPSHGCSPTTTLPSARSTRSAPRRTCPESPAAHGAHDLDLVARREAMRRLPAARNDGGFPPPGDGLDRHADGDERVARRRALRKLDLVPVDPHAHRALVY